MSIQDEQELLSLRAAGRIVRMVLDAMKAEVRPGVTTRYLDEIGARVMQANGARSAPSIVYQFPGASCISLNDEAVHGIPGERKLEEGDLVKLDVTVEKDGYMADAAITVLSTRPCWLPGRDSACLKSERWWNVRCASPGSQLSAN